ncbi:hypothetical protein [Comamonas odontotermitis]|uniref:hypothetical protein n=1 Tax=Comamonas odontotermitis TaxID=379895 RepID=UPI003752564A
MTHSILWGEYPIGDHRILCPACGTSPRKKDMGVTILSPEHGIAHCFKCGLIASKRDQRELSEVERRAYKRRMDALRKQHDAEQRERQARAAAGASQRWLASVPALDHPYLSAKGIKPHGIRVEAGHTLLIPLRDGKGHIHSLQSIAPDGSKHFMPGGRTKGCYHAIGQASGRLLIAEGYATAATLHEQTGYAVAVAFNCGNLLPVAQMLRAKYPCLTLVLCADDDWTTEGNPGLTAASAAAHAVGGLLAVPDFSGLDRQGGDTYFNDLQRLAGRVEVME